MSGHSHWHGIRHKKALTDAKKAKVFTKHGKLITIAAQEGGGSPDTNMRLKLLIQQARKDNMPNDNIERAIKRGTGELKGELPIQEITYEAYGPGNVAMMITVATDNKNRAVSDLKAVFKKHGGQLVSGGSVGFLFRSVGIISILLPKNQLLEDLELLAIDAGAVDIFPEEEYVTILTETNDLKTVEQALSTTGYEIDRSILGYWPHQKQEVNKSTQEQYATVMEYLEDLEDVQEVFDNI